MTLRGVAMIGAGVAAVAVLAGAVMQSNFLSSRPGVCSLTVFVGGPIGGPGAWTHNVTHVVGAPPRAGDMRFELTGPDPDGSTQVRASGNLSEPGALTFVDNPPQDGLVRGGDAFRSSRQEILSVNLYQEARLLGGSPRCH